MYFTQGVCEGLHSCLPSLILPDLNAFFVTTVVVVVGQKEHSVFLHVCTVTLFP